MVSDKGSSASCLKIILPPTGYVNVAEKKKKKLKINHDFIIAFKISFIVN